MTLNKNPQQGINAGAYSAEQFEQEIENALSWMDEAESASAKRQRTRARSHVHELSISRRDGSVTNVETLDTTAADICEGIAQTKGYVTLGPLTKLNIKGVPEPCTPIKLLRRVGRGGCGSVYLGQAAVDGAPLLAVKVSNDVNLSDILRQEVKAATLIPEHKCVHRLWGAGECNETGTLVVASPFIEGMDLEHLFDSYTGRNQYMSPLAVGLIGMRMLQGLGHLHSTTDENGKSRVGFVHRDIKPANVMIDKSGLTKLVDLGGTKPGVDAKGFLPLDGSWVGTPQYLHVAAMDSNLVPVGAPFNYAASDIHAVGTVLYELLTATLPWPTEIVEYWDTTMADMAKLSVEESSLSYMLAKINCFTERGLLPPRAIRPSIPKVLSDIVMDMLNPDLDTLTPQPDEKGRMLPAAIKFAQRLQKEYVHSAVYGLGMGIQDASIPEMMRLAGPDAVGTQDLRDNVLLRPLCVANHFENVAKGGETVISGTKNINYSTNAIRYTFKRELGPSIVKLFTDYAGQHWERTYNQLVDSRQPRVRMLHPHLDDTEKTLAAERMLVDDYMKKLCLHPEKPATQAEQ